MKQTAVEWLYKILHKENYIYEDMSEYLKQAKEMEKNQIIEAHGNKIKKSGSISNTTYILTGEQYYEETYNK
jgi:hypothetical protein